MRAHFLPFYSGSLLDHVAEQTGGLAIRNTNDLGAGLARVIDELREYYEVVYTPVALYYILRPTLADAVIAPGLAQDANPVV